MGRGADWGNVKLFRKTTKPASQEQFLPLLEVDLGDPWPIPVTVLHGVRPGPTITIFGGIHGDELTGASAGTHLLSNAFTDIGKSLDPNQLAGTIRIVPVVNLPGYREI